MGKRDIHNSATHNDTIFEILTRCQSFKNRVIVGRRIMDVTNTHNNTQKKKKKKNRNLDPGWTQERLPYLTIATFLL